jgi:hypothetical protein
LRDGGVATISPAVVTNMATAMSRKPLPKPIIP